jgi:hypothetical protein
VYRVGQGLRTRKWLFLQVDHQTAKEWLLCCFHQQDTTKVTVRLGTLEDSLRKYVHPDSISSLFTSADGLTFTNQVASITKGKNRLPRMEVPTHTADYVTQSMQKLYTPTAKCQATEMNSELMQETAPTAHIPRPTLATYATAVTPTAPVTPTNTGIPQGHDESRAVKDLQATTKEHSSTLAELRKCYASLATTQQQMANNMAMLTTDMNAKFSECENPCSLGSDPVWED